MNTNTKTAAPTPGPVVVDYGQFDRRPFVRHGKQVVAILESTSSPGGFDRARGGTTQANAALIAEAFNVHHETGLTPSQLRALLVEAREALRGLAGCELHYAADAPKQAAARATLAKLEGVK